MKKTTCLSVCMLDFKLDEMKYKILFLYIKWICRNMSRCSQITIIIIKKNEELLLNICIEVGNTTYDFLNVCLLRMAQSLSRTSIIL